MKVLWFISLFVMAICVSCTAYEGKSDTSAFTEHDESTPAKKQASATKGIREVGLLKEVEDSGYPLLTLTIEFPKRHVKEYFVVNLEEVNGTNVEDMNTWVGQYVSFAYTSELTNALLDLQLDGKSLLDEDNTAVNAQTQKITGLLSGADEETAGDLPGKISITATDNTVLDFEFFVTKEMVEANGESVVGFYEERTANTIKSINLVSK
ncbi:hypothetical protein GO730_32035 [Spirosoma sp. HMF3257]|uniref:Lipoprotein n=1 Tax=Spirosoma telluris TaxID=2183553 RepID=A0A327NUS7_9BACT|nr:hypothetical protein [Spirosoma telluris]RAI77614.1 hypothetical protein HMF3257_31930 [Spirosoma telluris]